MNQIKNLVRKFLSRVPSILSQPSPTLIILAVYSLAEEIWSLKPSDQPNQL